MSEFTILDLVETSQVVVILQDVLVQVKWCMREIFEKQGGARANQIRL